MDFPRVPRDAPIVIDTETNGLDWKKSHMVGFVLTVGPLPADTFYFPIRHETGPNLPEGEVLSWMKDLLHPQRKVVGHHLKFDLHILWNEGVLPPHQTECTLVNQGLINENMKGYGLEEVARYHGVQAKKGKEVYEYLAGKFGGNPVPEQMANFWRLPANDTVANEYARGDGTSTWQVWQKQQETLDYEDLRDVWALECRVTRTLTRMERNGVGVDLDRLKWFEGWVKKRLKKAEALLPKGFNVRSGPQIRKLMEQRGHTNWPTTPPSKKFPQGQPSFTKEWLETFPLGETVVTVRQLTNIGNSFATPLRERHLHEGKVYTTFNQSVMDDYGTVTGRLSSSDPNMQQVPKRDKVLAPAFRSIFIPCIPGAKWSANDYSQQEYRVFAHYTQAKKLVEGYNKVPFDDIHTVVAKLLNVERDPRGKRMNMGMLNSMGIVKLAKSIGVDDTTAKRYRDLYYREMPEIQTFNKTARQRAKIRGWVHTILGRRARLGPGEDFPAPSRIIQGTSADMTKLKMVEVDEFFEKNGDQCKLMLQIHDDLSWAVPPGCEDQDAEATRIMEAFGPDDAIEFSVPIIVDHATGPNWGIASFPKANWDEYK